jgi:predicted DNA-binding helix-hairpin-helix protein
MSIVGNNDWLFPVDLETPMEELLRLHGLTMRSNNRMMNEGQDCELRWRGDVSCLACPLSEANNPSSAKSHLCRTSTQEERLSTLLAAKSGGG